MTLSDDQRARLARRLLEERARVTAILDDAGSRLRLSGRETAGDLSSAPLHPADLATDAFAREFDAGQETRLSAELTEIDAALERLYRDPARFGRDERTGEAIPFERLELVPWARRQVGNGEFEGARPVERAATRDRA